LFGWVYGGAYAAATCWLYDNSDKPTQRWHTLWYDATLYAPLLAVHFFTVDAYLPFRVVPWAFGVMV